MMQDNADEIFPIVDDDGTVIGRATRGECHGGSKLLHPVVHLHVFDASGRLYLQKRPSWKDIQPGKWDTAVGGHVGFGEEMEAALVREVMEELGLESFAPMFISRYVFESDRERELVHVFATRVADDAVIAPSEELDGGRFWTIAELEDQIGQEVFTPNFEREYLSVLKPYMAETAGLAHSLNS